jgi:hypothetical protein
MYSYLIACKACIVQKTQNVSDTINCAGDCKLPHLLQQVRSQRARFYRRME